VNPSDWVLLAVVAAVAVVPVAAVVIFALLRGYTIQLNMRRPGRERRRRRWRQDDDG
jgi:hypothetical protein